MSPQVVPLVPPGTRVLLVGGAGFIGHALALRLKADGADPLVVDSFTVNHIKSPKEMSRPGINRDLYLTIAGARLGLLEAAGIRVIEQDARDSAVLASILDEFRPDAVVVLAAISHASRSNADPHRAFENGAGTLEASLEAVRGRPGTHLVYMSSSMVYGNFVTPTVDETAPCDPLGIYGALKFGGETLIRAYHRVFGLEYTIVRPSAAYGPGCIGRRFIQTSIENALGGMPLQIKGDGAEKIDFTYIDDLVDGLVRVLAVPEARNEIINVTTGNATSLLTAATLVAGRFPGSTIQHLQREALLPKRGTLDIGKARRLLGFEPRWNAQTGIDAYVDWYLAMRDRDPGLFVIDAPLANE